MGVKLVVGARLGRRTERHGIRRTGADNIELRDRRPVLGSVRRGNNGVECRKRREEALLFALEQSWSTGQLEHGRHKVLLARVLLEATNQIADGHIEFGGVHDRRIEEQAADVFLHGLGLAGGHAEQHLKLDSPGDAALLREKVGISNIEQVVTCDTDGDSIRILGRECPIEHALVVGVAVLLGRVGRERPVVYGGINVFHGEVRALHEAHLDGRSAVGTARL